MPNFITEETTKENKDMRMRRFKRAKECIEETCDRLKEAMLNVSMYDPDSYEYLSETMIQLAHKAEWLEALNNAWEHRQD